MGAKRSAAQVNDDCRRQYSRFYERGALKRRLTLICMKIGMDERIIETIK
jgi:hypothetical protein